MADFNMNAFKSDTLNQNNNADIRQKLFDAATYFNQQRKTSNEVNIFSAQSKNALSGQAYSGCINQNTNNTASIFNQNNLTNKETSTVIANNNTTTTEINNTTQEMNDSEKAKHVLSLLNKANAEFSVNIDGKIGDFQQNKQSGDCWLLSGIETLSNTQEGADIISKSIVQNQDGTVSVTLQGADKTYTFTREEIAKAKDRFSSGDDDVRVLELAVEQYRAEQISKGEFKANKYTYIYGPTAGGKVDDAGKILTDEEPEMVTENYDKYLDLIASNPEKYGAEIDFKYENPNINKGDDNIYNDIMTHHAYSIKSVDDQNVSVINPFYSDQEVIIPRNEFVNNVKNMGFYS